MSTTIVAELSANHKQDINIALETIKSAKENGADAIKIQTYTPDTMTIDCDKEDFIVNCNSPWDGETLYQLYKRAYTPWEWYPKLKECAEELGLTFFSTPFDKTAVDFLEKHECPIYKIASFEIMDTQLIEYSAQKGKPMILSTGVATMSEIEEAVNICKRYTDDVTLLKCTSSYPAPLENVNLRTMANMRETFGVKVGLSDHTVGNDVAIAAAALGAEVIEKHFIIDRNLGGPDSSFSLEPKEFKKLTDSIRNVEKALGKISYKVTEEMKKNRSLARSLYVVKDIKKGEELTEENVRSIRPGYGLHPKYINNVLGRKANCKIKKGTKLSYSLIS